MTSTVDIIAQRLYAAGCRHAFGIPGGEVLAIIEALDRAGIGFTLAKHENAAGFMAEGVHHADGAPGILVATLGPGVANAVNVIANAEQDRVPLIVLTGCLDPGDRLQFTHQVFDHTALLSPITKASFTAPAEAADIMIDKAVTIAAAPRPGPVHIDVPIKVATSAHGAARLAPSPPPAPLAPAEGPELTRARAMLAASRRPLLIAGLDVLYEPGAVEGLRAFAEQFQIPVLTTYKAKGVLPETHELTLGGHGLSPKSDRHVLPLLRSADLILAAGYDPIEMRAGWIEPWDPEQAIEFAPVANRHYVHRAGLSFHCGIGPGLAALAAGVPAPAARWPGGEVDKARQALAADFAPGDGWGPGAAVAALQQAVPGEAVVTVDTGAHRILLSQMWRCAAPRRLLQSTGLCTMGCALPLAIGHKLAAPERPVLAVSGDAGLEMVLGELATLRDLKLRVVVAVFVDEQLALIELKQRQTGRDNLGVDFGGTDFAALAEAMGGAGRVAGDAEAVMRETRDAFAREGFTVIAIPIGRQAYDGTF